MKKFMVWDTASDDKVFHDTQQKALKDYNDAIEMIYEEGLAGEFEVYFFELKDHKHIEILLDED